MFDHETEDPHLPREVEHLGEAEVRVGQVAFHLAVPGILKKFSPPNTLAFCVVRFLVGGRAWDAWTYLPHGISEHRQIEGRHADAHSLSSCKPTKGKNL